MSDPRQIIEYARVPIAREIQIRREGDDLTITIPPPSFWRIMTLALLRVSTLLALFAIAAVVFYLLDSNTNAASPLIFPCALLPAMILTLLRVARVALAGSRPTVIRASPLGLQIDPRGMTFRRCNWPATELIDLEVRHGGGFPLLAPRVQFRLMFTADRIETYTIPWNGAGALANVEDNLREILSLPRIPH